MESLGYRPRIQDAWRSPADQLEAYRQGYSQVMYGFHNVTATNGIREALAADILDDNRPLTAQTDFMLRLTAAAEKNGLTTGIRWGLSDTYVQAINAAITTQNWSAPVHVGWDPLHVEATGLTIPQAKAGIRPPMPGDPDDGTPPGEGETVPNEPTPLPKRRYKVDEVDTPNTTDYELSGALRPATLLPVPYFSQLGPGADEHSNDCGPACAVMLLSAYQKCTLTPNEFYARFGIQGDLYLSVNQLRNAMSSVGLLTDFKANLSISDLFGALASGKPLIVLLRYKTLVDAGLTEKTFQGPHFAVVVGIDCKYIYIHDPLYTNPLAGEAHAYPLTVFWQAWKDVASDPNIPNPERSAIIPTTGIGFQMTRQVRVTIPTLNVRSGPGLNNPVLGTVKKDNILQVTREMSGWGEIGFNQWVLLAYTAPA
jgi:hypothetical protein